MTKRLFAVACLFSALACGPSRAQTDLPEPGFSSLFNGQNTLGWKLVGGVGPGYVAKKGLLICPADGGGNLFTEKEYEDFVFRFEFKLAEGSNNGIGIRSPLSTDISHVGMEIQILDDYSARYADIRPAQHHGSVYDIIPAKQNSLKKAGEWNKEEIDCRGRRVKVTVNDQVVVDADLNEVADAETLRKHPGLFRTTGHIGFLGHNEYVEFRNIRVREFPVSNTENNPPAGFMALFNGRNLDGWKGLVADPPKRAKMSPEELAAAQVKADERMREHWHPTEGVIVFDGKGDNLCTAKDYADFEMWVDWKILKNGDSGIYLRGSPQVQIWDPTNSRYNPKNEGSGGLYNNQKNPSGPLKIADKPIGEWNHFKIVMVGEKVHVFLNDELVVKDVTLENYWERDKPIYPSGALELQNHGDTLYFKNVYVREIHAR